MHFKKRRPPRGARPGTLVIGDDASAPRMRVIKYDGSALEERDLKDPDELASMLEPGKIVWLDVQGLGDEALLKRLADIFKMHPLAIEDVVNAPQRPKSDSYEHNHLLITRYITAPQLPALEQEQVSVLVGEGYVVTFQEKYGDNFDPVRDRLRSGHTIIRSATSDYLAYALVDAIIDGYYPVLEQLSDYIEELDEAVLENATSETLSSLAEMKHTLTQLRRTMWPQRDAMNRVVRDDNPFISPKVRVFFRDVLDHTQQATEVVESFREVVTSQMNTYLSVVSNRTNDVMRVLTIISTIFIPLTFLAGIYGMNFRYMPELEQRLAYPALLLAMGVICLAQLAFFWRRGWLGGSRKAG